MDPFLQRNGAAEYWVVEVRDDRYTKTSTASDGDNRPHGMDHMVSDLDSCRFILWGFVIQ